MKKLLGNLVGTLEEVSGDKKLFHRHLVSQGRDAPPEEIITEGADLDQIRTWTVILKETEKLRRSIHDLPDWEGREKIALEKAKVDLMALKLNGPKDAEGGIVELPAVLPENTAFASAQDEPKEKE